MILTGPKSPESLRTEQSARIIEFRQLREDFLDDLALRVAAAAARGEDRWLAAQDAADVVNKPVDALLIEHYSRRTP